MAATHLALRTTRRDRLTATWDTDVAGRRVIVVRDDTNTVVAYVSHLDTLYLSAIGDAINSLCQATCNDSTTRQITV